MNDISTSIIITTYNWPEALGLVLRSICEQSVLPGELIIADDGSGPETAMIIKETLSSSGLRWCHLRHEDRSVRQSRIKNLAVKYSHYPYLIFVDHDVVLHPYFISDHLSAAEKGVFLQGKRALLPGYYTDKVISEGRFSPPGFWTEGVGNRKNLLRSPGIGRCVSRVKRYETSLRGCNLSMFKSDFLKADGFDETFDGSWGREDSDICYRLFHNGVKVRILWFTALQYHLKHKVTDNWHKTRLNGELGLNIKEKRKRAIKGFSALSPEGEIIACSEDFQTKEK